MSSCYRCVEKTRMVKYGRSKSGKPRLLCKQCGKTQVSHFSYKAYEKEVNERIVTLTKEGLGIRSTARILHISAATVLKRLLSIAAGLKRPPIRKGRTYEVDELCTFVGNKTKTVWVTYALDRHSRCVAGFYLGPRTNHTLNAVLKTLNYADARSIYTDGLRNYHFLIPKQLHKSTRYGTNRIERMNLSLRTHLKRLSRRTICFSRNRSLLWAVLAIYFWG